MGSPVEEISLLLQQGWVLAVKQKITEALEQKIGPDIILRDGLLAGMDIIGEKFKNNQVFIPEVMLAAQAMNQGLVILKPLLAGGLQGNSKGTVVIGTVKGDMHDIGKNLVKMMLEGKGLTVIDLGVDVSAERYIAAAHQHGASVICCSALLTTTMKEMKAVVAQLSQTSMAGKVKIMIGGAPVTQSFCDSIGADSYTPDAASAAEVALRFCS